MSFVVTIGGEDKTSSVVFNSLRKQDNLNQQVDSLEFTIRRYGDLTFIPALQQEVIVTRDGATLFGGVMVRIRETVDAGHIVGYRVICNEACE